MLVLTSRERWREHTNVWGNEMRILVVVNAGKEMAVTKSLELRKWLDDNGVENMVINSGNIIVDGRFSDNACSSMRGVGLICTLGGDGTLLTAAQLAFRYNVPIMGVNFGHLGFLTGATSDVLIESVQAALNHQLIEDHRCALDITLEDHDGTERTYTVLNEVAVTRGVTGRMIDYEVRIDGDTLTHMRADGVIVSSPSGSTAYSLSAGGPIISPSLSCMVVVALAPHSLISRALVTGEQETVTIVPEDRSDKECTVFLDGNRQPLKRSPARVTARVRKDAITLLRYNALNFTRSASRVFFGDTND